MALPPAHQGFFFCKTLHQDTYPFIDPKHAEASHKSHSVFVTGASKGIGRSISLAFARSGVPKIAIGARSSLDSLESEIIQAAFEAGHPAPLVLKLQIDIMHKESVKRAAQDVEKAFGDDGLDILVNNAGWLETFTPMKDIDVDDWWHTWEVNVRGLFLVTHAFLPIVLKSRDKTVITVSSVGAHGFEPGASAYQTTKLATLRLTEFMNVDHGDEGLLAYAVHPGMIGTEMGKRMPEHLHWLLNDSTELPGDTIAFLTRERREWLRSRYISATWDMEELLGREAEIVEEDKLKVRMII
ncbi:NAD-P-binding protein [Stereum hirsutum FP-91666 SS1]|uniref:NAD-P-binding protein n=1 Tax=Stereum hirsutum (strain FP-91666) TaxID=721885 RepID=UPI000440BF50|nr:NAD-P-binding protein [Stereum hirsutum FP-91666 SS1]EIM87602.1 NAD-P-binding protein [Stereum hirsutum FP-91666 SS1]